MDTKEEWNIVQSLLEQQDYSTCIVLLELLWSKQPRHPTLWYWLAYSFIHINHPTAALETLEQYCSWHPKDIDLSISTALLIANFDATNFLQAEEIAKKGMKTYPEESIFYRYMGLIRARTNNEQAEEFFYEAHRVNPLKNPIPPPPPDPSIFKTAVSWLPSSAQSWIRGLDIHFEGSPTLELLNQEDFPHHPLVPFLLYNNTIYVFLDNLRYQPQYKRASTALFEQLLELWNDYENNNTAS